MKRTTKKLFFAPLLKNIFFIGSKDAKPANFNRAEGSQEEEEYLNYYRQSTRWQRV